MVHSSGVPLVAQAQDRGGRSAQPLQPPHPLFKRPIRPQLQHQPSQLRTREPLRLLRPGLGTRSSQLSLPVTRDPPKIKDQNVYAVW